MTHHADNADGTLDIGAYCRDIEAYLCRRNGGHLVRIVGPAFMLVSEWARRGIPLRVVLHGIDRRIARAEAKGGTRRPLRLEFCTADVENAYAQWRRAVGAHAVRGHPTVSDGAPAEDVPAGSAPTSRRPSLSRHIERVVERLSSIRAAMEIPPGAGEAIDVLLMRLDECGRRARGARGDVRAAIEAELLAMDQALVDAVMMSAPAERLLDLEQQARRELAPLARRLTHEARADAERRLTRHLVRTAYELPQVAVDG